MGLNENPKKNEVEAWDCRQEAEAAWACKWGSLSSLAQPTDLQAAIVSNFPQFLWRCCSCNHNPQSFHLHRFPISHRHHSTKAATVVHTCRHFLFIFPKYQGNFDPCPPSEHTTTARVASAGSRSGLHDDLDLSGPRGPILHQQ